MALRNFIPKLVASATTINLTSTYQDVIDISESYGALDDFQCEFNNSRDVFIRISFNDEVYFEGDSSILGYFDNDNIIMNKSSLRMNYNSPLYFINSFKIEMKTDKNNKNVTASLVRYRGENR